MSTIRRLSRRTETLEKRIGEILISYNPDTIQKEVVDPLFDEWEALSEQIHDAHDKRNGQANSLMEKGIALYEKLIVTTSSQSINCH